MTFAGINYLAVLIATIAGFAFGAAYYMSMSRPWLAAIGKTREAFGCAITKVHPDHGTVPRTAQARACMTSSLSGSVLSSLRRSRKRSASRSSADNDAV